MPSPQNVHTQSSQCSCPVLFGYDSSQSRNKRGCRLKTHLLLLTMFYICVSCTEQTPLDPKGTIVYESILLQHLLQISTTEAWDFNSCCSDRYVVLLVLVAFSFFTFQFLQQFFLGASKVLFYSVQLQSIFC
jgi:hypothetical protein